MATRGREIYRRVSRAAFTQVPPLPEEVDLLVVERTLVAMKASERLRPETVRSVSSRQQQLKHVRGLSIVRKGLAAAQPHKHGLPADLAVGVSFPKSSRSIQCESIFRMGGVDMSRPVDRQSERKRRPKIVDGLLYWVGLLGFLAQFLFWGSVLGLTIGLSNGWIASIIYPSGEYFGRFSEPLDNRWVNQPSGRPYTKLLVDFWFEDASKAKWTVPAGHIGDGASIPQYLWTFAGPYEGDYVYAAVIHDYYCETRERPADDTHLTFYNGMRAMKVPKWQADFMYWAVKAFGPTWTLTDAGESRQSAVVDLSDPVVLAAAKAKSAAIARTLQSSDGQVLELHGKRPGR